MRRTLSLPGAGSSDSSNEKTNRQPVPFKRDAEGAIPGLALRQLSL
jgi:hypothetical protein